MGRTTTVLYFSSYFETDGDDYDTDIEIPVLTFWTIEMEDQGIKISPNKINSKYPPRQYLDWDDDVIKKTKSSEKYSKKFKGYLDDMPYFSGTKKYIKVYQKIDIKST